MDFGLARRLGGELREILGTPEYVGKLTPAKRARMNERRELVRGKIIGLLSDISCARLIQSVCEFSVATKRQIKQ